jgi:hypothetical protein
VSVDKDFVLNALLRHNYLPMQKHDREEVPPVFSSESFLANPAFKNVQAQQRNGSIGWDAIEYRLTRFNGVSRSLAIPHPLAYAHLCLCIHENWEHLDYIEKNETSLIRPHQHKDGRLIIMDYEESIEKAQRSANLGFGRRFLVHTDISNCFPSIYSHAIPWATVGFAYAKAHKPPKYKAEWFNQLDEKLRWTKRNETQGIAIGPATSNVLSESILAKVDEALNKDFIFVRFIDDYTAYCRTEDETQEFIRRLAEELSKYKLLLNIGKTDILPLPQAASADWVLRLALTVPKRDEVNAYDAVSFLSFAVELAKSEPDGSVLKYAVKALLRKKLGFTAEFDVLPQVLTLSFHQPVLLPSLESLFEKPLLPRPFRYSDELHTLAMENTRFRRSDGMCWTLYYLNKYKVKIKDELADRVIASKDCLALLLLYRSGHPRHQKQVVAFAKSLDQTDPYDLDQYWLLLYQLFLDNCIGNPYSDEETFLVLKQEGVSFLASATS